MNGRNQRSKTGPDVLRGLSRATYFRRLKILRQELELDPINNQQLLFDRNQQDHIENNIPNEEQHAVNENVYNLEMNRNRNQQDHIENNIPNEEQNAVNENVYNLEMNRNRNQQDQIENNIPNEEQNAVNENVYNLEMNRNRLLKSEIIYTSATYERITKTNSSWVKYQLGNQTRYGLVYCFTQTSACECAFFCLPECRAQYFAVIQKCNVNCRFNAPGNQFSYIYELTSLDEEYDIIRIENLITVCFNIEIKPRVTEKCQYIIGPVDCLEND
ncbi:hypothetical protein HCN44_007201 [Aphidius gifuensis]|uniref:Uncharacterized protein n=1 Tax=Aphidius gifuensis TaxID=684658 RepID=A0A834XQ63_APHGI|nr:hypothetical protein HCN44_007201 [Aphidius gifuensis]